MDEERREIPRGGMLVKDGVIDSIASSEDLDYDGAKVIDLSRHLVFPGLVNTHHHLYQTLTRAVPGAQDANLFEWLRMLYVVSRGWTRPCTASVPLTWPCEWYVYICVVTVGC